MPVDDPMEGTSKPIEEPDELQPGSSEAEASEADAVKAADGGRMSKVRKAALPSLAVAGGLGALGLLRNRLQQSQTFVPEKYPTGLWQPESFGINAEDVFFSAADDTSLHAWWMPVRRARGTVLYCHGNSGNITNRIGVFRFLHRIKLNVLAFDYRGYGRSEGTPTESGVFLDAQAAYDELVGSIGEREERILIFGHSLGGAVAIDCALHRPAAGLVAQSTFTHLRDMARVRFPRMPLHLVTSNHFRSLDKVPRLNLPKLFIHGTADETIPHALGELLYERAADPKEWYSVPHAGHNDVYRFGGLRYLWRMVSFSRRCLKAAKKSG